MKSSFIIFLSVLLFSSIELSLSYPLEYIKQCLIDNKKKLNSNEKKILSILKGNYLYLLNFDYEIINELYQSKIISNCLYEYSQSKELSDNIKDIKTFNPAGILTCMERLAPVSHDIREIYALIQVENISAVIKKIPIVISEVIEVFNECKNDIVQFKS